MSTAALADEKNEIQRPSCFTLPDPLTTAVSMKQTLEPLRCCLSVELCPWMSSNPLLTWNNPFRNQAQVRVFCVESAWDSKSPETIPNKLLHAGIIKVPRTGNKHVLSNSNGFHSRCLDFPILISPANSANLHQKAQIFEYPSQLFLTTNVQDEDDRDSGLGESPPATPSDWILNPSRTSTVCFGEFMLYLVRLSSWIQSTKELSLPV